MQLLQPQFALVLWKKHAHGMASISRELATPTFFYSSESKKKNKRGKFKIATSFITLNTYTSLQNNLRKKTNR